MQATEQNAFPTSPEAPNVRSVVHWLSRTDDSAALAVARIALALVILPHGAQKLLGLFGGHGFAGTMGFLTDTMGLPWIVGFLTIMAESIGALALLVGAGSRVAALGIGAVMVGAVVTVHGQFGFFMNWFGNQSGEGFEYHLLALGLAAAVVLGGAGRWSLDRAFSRATESSSD